MRTPNRVIAVVAALALALVACGRDEPSGDGGDADQAPAPTGPVAGELTVWAMGTKGENLGVLAEDFMADNPDVE